MDRTPHRGEVATRMPGMFAPRAGGGENRQSAFGKAYQSCLPCLLGPLNRPGCTRFFRILSSIEECRRGRDGTEEEGRAQGNLRELLSAEVSPPRRPASIASSPLIPKPKPAPAPARALATSVDSSPSPAVPGRRASPRFLLSRARPGAPSKHDH